MRESKFTVTVSPGEIAETENVTYEGKSYLIRGIQEWLDRVHEELRAVPVYRQVNEQREQLEEFLKKFEGLPNEYFSQDEATKLKLKFEEIQSKLEENITASVKNQDEANKKIQSLQSDIDVLKENLEVLKKPSWAGALAVRVFEWVKDPVNRKVLTTGAQAAAELMLETGDSSIDNTEGG